MKRREGSCRRPADGTAAEVAFSLTVSFLLFLSLSLSYSSDSPLTNWYDIPRCLEPSVPGYCACMDHLQAGVVNSSFFHLLFLFDDDMCKMGVGWGVV